MRWDTCSQQSILSKMDKAPREALWIMVMVSFRAPINFIHTGGLSSAGSSREQCRSRCHLKLSNVGAHTAEQTNDVGLGWWGIGAVAASLADSITTIGVSKIRSSSAEIPEGMTFHTVSALILIDPNWLIGTANRNRRFVLVSPGGCRRIGAHVRAHTQSTKIDFSAGRDRASEKFNVRTRRTLGRVSAQSRSQRHKFEVATSKIVVIQQFGLNDQTFGLRPHFALTRSRIGLEKSCA
mmetsp:Transcript_92151/g.232564  ORF Transcript_92151/g.232564 Transcript_92151/m.232564 type:complete len:238 (-) Transcript_92151:226-939(-)